MKRLSFIAIALALLTLSCGGRQAAAPTDTASAETVDTVATDLVEEVDTLELLIAETPMPRAADELFDDFLFNFAANRNLQSERVVFPLPTTKGGKTTYVSKGEWKMERFFMHQDYYTVLFDDQQQMELVRDTSVSLATVEKIYFNTGAVIQYQFRRVKGAWMLCEVSTEPIAQNRNASFLDFYHRFVTDSVFQAESLAQTVVFVGPDPDDDFAQMEGILTPDTWPAFAPDLPDRMIYNIVYGRQEEDSDERIFMMRGIANGMELEMTFRRNDGQWKLVKMRE